MAAPPKQTDTTNHKSLIADWCLRKNLGQQIPGHLFVQPGLSNDGSSQILWSPHRKQSFKHSFFLASSRIGRKPELIPSWFDAVRTVCSRIEPATTVLLTAANVTTDVYVNRAADVFQIPLVELRTFPNRLTAGWFKKTRQAAIADAPLKTIVYIEHDQHSASIDETLMSLASHVKLLSVSGSGKIYKNALRRLHGIEQQSELQKQTWILVDSQLTKPSIQEELIAAGACPWWLYKKEAPENHSTNSHAQNEKHPAKAQTRSVIVSKASLNPDEYLLHWTRRQNGPWPGEPAHSTIDNLLFGSRFASQDRLATLSRILATGKLIASSKLTRDSTPVVCFSNVPVDKLPELRTFRSHLSRWDFETVGIAIRKDVLRSWGAKQVIYGDDEKWHSLTPEQRPLFQLAQSKTKKGVIDWTVEKEWRVVGDIDLRRLKPKDAFLFVSSDEEAQIVATLSRWPVMVL